jgi:hypothetical protein
MTSLVLKRYDGEFMNLDLTSGDETPFHFWMNKMSMKEVEELTGESYKI